ncbi:Os03g0246000 [Oryza sativa Japonica Group]|uniref:Os03g0246000 protein n=1 Tax=Oryza sativa subsp. japonica TaxID=39947 RepID=A0A0P0VVQ3_ORYSJ|nr:Os03g0246000 [Oryza sativa Japonica Group]
MAVALPDRSFPAGHSPSPCRALAVAGRLFSPPSSPHLSGIHHVALTLPHSSGGHSQICHRGALSFQLTLANPSTYTKNSRPCPIKPVGTTHSASAATRKNWTRRHARPWKLRPYPLI